MMKKVKKELVEWIVILGVMGIIYLGGWHTEVIGRIQQAVLYTGIISPSLADENLNASYDFILEDLDGNEVDFSNFKNEVVFVNFWATWCPPCIAEMPDIHSLYKETSSSVSYVMISLDREKQKAKEFVSKKEFEFPVYFLKSRIPSMYDIQSIPTTYLIDKKGKVHVENHGMAKYNTGDFKELLSRLSQP